eukprot:Gb_25653 [translate_table: standard]
MRRKDECIKFVNEMIEMEKCMDFTVKPTYMKMWNRLMQPKGPVMDALGRGVGRMVINGIRDVNIEQVPLSDHMEVAFDMKIRVVAYWKVVILRLANGIPLHLMLIRNVKNEIAGEIMKEVAGPKLNMIDKILEESPAVSNR